MNPIQVPETGNDEFKDLIEKERGLLEDGEAAAISGLAVDRFPESSEEVALAEQLLVEEIEKLSLVEHEKVMFDVHGIATPHEEDSQIIKQKLQEMEEHVRKIRRKKAYDLAKYINEAYVQNADFRLMFLRADRYDAKLSAQRLLRHFEVKKQLFGGGEVLARDVLLTDLSSEDMQALESGFIQILPSRDSSGRPIFSVAPMHRPKDVQVINCTRALWYVLSNSLKDEEAQKRGMVGINFNVGHRATREPLSLMKQIFYIRSGLPKRIAGIHYCYNDTSLKPFVAGLRLFMDKEARIRFRSHFGEHETITFELQTYGIPTKLHPILPNGDLCVAYHREWLHVRRAQEQEMLKSTASGVILPRRFDVLFGRGKNTREHTGNLRAGHLVEMFHDEYEKAGKFEKTEVAQRIVGMIHDSFGRFLKWEANGWVEVDDEAAREKISHFFRHLRSKKPAKEATSTSSNQEQSSEVVKRVTPCPSPVHLSSEGSQLKKQARGQGGKFVL